MDDKPGRHPAPFPLRELRRAPRSVLTGILAAPSLILVVAAATPLQARQQEEPGCGERASLAVTVRDDSGTMPMPNATVVLRWTDAIRRPVREVTDVTGRLVLCVPRDARQATLWAEFGDASSKEEMVVIVPEMTHAVELRLLFEEMKTGRLIGQVLDARTHQPVAAAEISFPDRAERVQSNRRGRFVFSGLPVGEYELSVRHIGYDPLTHAVTVKQGTTTDVEIGLSADPVELEPLVATVERSRRLEIKGFYERKYWGELTGLGTFITAEDIERWRPLQVRDLVSMLVPSVGPALTNRRVSSGFGNLSCAMPVYLDGIAITVDELDQFVKPVEVGGIEVYKGAASVPAEYAGSVASCGAVVVWTK